MRAAVFHGPGTGIRLEDVPDPKAGAGQVVVRVAACGICHTDLHYLDHGVATGKAPPIILGHEITGVIEEAGADGWRRGDRVLVPSTWACRRCRSCRQGRETLCERLVMPGNHADGGFARLVAVPAAECVRLPETVPIVEASVVADALSTAYHAVADRGRPRPGEWAAVFGCGGVGLSVVQCAVAAGARVIAVDVRERSLALARAFGAAETIDARSVPSVEKEIRKRTDGGVPLAFEVIGNPRTLAQAFGSLRRGGRLCAVGYCPEEVPVPFSKVMFFEQEILGSLGCPRANYPAVLSLVERGILKAEPLVTARVPLADIGRGLDLLRAGEGLRTVVVMD